MNRTKYLIKNTLLFAFGNLGTKIISFLMVPLYTHYLSVSEYGTLDIIFTISLILSPLILGNIHEAVMRFLLDKDSEKDKIITNAIIMFIFGGILSLIILIVLTMLKLNETYLFIIPIYVFVSAVYQIPFGYIRGIEKNELYVILNILSTFLVASLNIIFLVYLKMGINGYFVSLIISNIVIIVLGVISSKMYIYFSKLIFDKMIFLYMIKYSLFLIPNSLLWWITNSSDRIMVATFLGSKENGLYAIAYKLPTVLSMLSTIFMQSWQLTAIREKKADDISEYSNIIFNNYLKFLFLSGSGLLLFLKPIMKVYIADSYFVSWMYSPLLIFAFIFGALGGFLGMSYTVAKDSKGMMLSALSGAIINILLNFLLVPRIGINGASLASCISYFVVLLYRAITTRKYLAIYILKPSYISILLLFSVQVFAVYLDGNISYILMSIIFIVLGIFSYSEIKTVLIWLIKKPLSKDLRIYYRGKKNES